MMDTAEVHGPQLSAADRVYQYAKGAILSRRIGAHDLLTEGELADSVGVSRTPVREALLRLQAEGLVRLLPKRGALILPVTADEVSDVLETRRLVETFAVRKAITAPTSTRLVGRLETHLERMRAAMRERDARTYVEADRDFHEAIVAATGNEILTSLYRSLRDRQLRMGVVNLLEERTGELDSSGVARMRDNIADHEAILTGISTRAIRASEAAVTAHLDRADHQLRR
ncbi:MAG TPA: GntR family transcriptional regulator [Jatrophihabitans sp.]|jgi:DNA-binding GntR family transcriptional regulator